MPRIFVYKSAIHNCSVKGLNPVLGGPPQRDGWRFCPFCAESLGEEKSVSLPPKPFSEGVTVKIANPEQYARCGVITDIMTAVTLYVEELRPSEQLDRWLVKIRGWNEFVPADGFVPV